MATNLSWKADYPRCVQSGFSRRIGFQQAKTVQWPGFVWGNAMNVYWCCIFMLLVLAGYFGLGCLLACWPDLTIPSLCQSSSVVFGNRMIAHAHTLIVFGHSKYHRSSYRTCVNFYWDIEFRAMTVGKSEALQVVVVVFIKDFEADWFIFVVGLLNYCWPLSTKFNLLSG